MDGVAYAPHRAIDVTAWDVDYYALSFYKVYGPHHAVLYGKYDQLLALDNLYHYFVAKDRIPYKLQPGNPNYELSYGCIGIADYLVDLGQRLGVPVEATRRAAIEAAWSGIAVHEATLAARLLDYLRGRRGVRVLGPATADEAVRVPTVSFVVEGVDSGAIVRHTDTARPGHPPRRLPFPAPGRVAGLRRRERRRARVARALQHGGRSRSVDCRPRRGDLDALAARAAYENPIQRPAAATITQSAIDSAPVRATGAPATCARSATRSRTAKVKSSAAGSVVIFTQKAWL